MGLSMKQVSDDDKQVFNNWLQPSESPKPPQSNKRSHQQLQQPQPLNCPRCNSANTKFCYYNNYNRTQPRHFCKACKRHWTKGGTLRNVPVGGGRKNKRHKPSQGPPAATTTTTTVNPPLSNLYQINHLPSFLSHEDNAFMYNTESLMNHHESMQFSFSGSNSEINRSLNNIATSFQKLENMEKSVINNPAGIDDKAWEFEQVLGNENNSMSSVMELASSSYWNWNEFDTTTVGDFSIPNWDETDIKP